MYLKVEGGKVGNEVTLLIMKYLYKMVHLDGTTQLELSIIMDNRSGQNKNNCVLRVPTYLTMKGYFQLV